MYRGLCTDRFSYDLTIFYACHVLAELKPVNHLDFAKNQTKRRKTTWKVDVLDFEPHAKYGFISMEGGHVVANEITCWSANISLFPPKKKIPRQPQMLKDWPI